MSLKYEPSSEPHLDARERGLGEHLLQQRAFGHARLLFSKRHDGKGANGSKNGPHDAYPVRCHVPGYYEPCSERVRVCQLKTWRQLFKNGLGFTARPASPVLPSAPACSNPIPGLGYWVQGFGFRVKS